MRPSLLLVVIAIGCGSGGQPQITAIDPPFATARGGERIHITGPGVGSATSVHFGALDAVSIERDGDDGLFAVTPLTVAGPVEVVVTTPDGEASVEDLFRFDPLSLSFVDAADAVPADDSRSRGPTFFDADGDGDLDAVLAVRGGPPRLYLGDGMGHLALAPPEALPVEAVDGVGAAVGDVDGDGVEDVFLTVFGGQDRLLLGNGLGSFTDATATWLPVEASSDLGPVLGDIDADGDLDLVIATYGADAAGHSQDLVWSNANGRFEDRTASALPPSDDQTASAALADVDGDGDLDLVTCNDRDGDPALRLFSNDGTGVFTEASPGAAPVQSERCRAVLAGDLDLDGDVDIVAVGRGQDRLHVNDGSGHFLDRTVLALPVDGADGFGAVLADLDRDSDLDLAIANNGAQDRLYLNDGSGRFLDETLRLPPDAAPSVGVAAGDLDGDGDLDLLVATEAGAPDRLLISSTAWSEGGVP